jgi:hypothetical protein
MLRFVDIPIHEPGLQLILVSNGLVILEMSTQFIPTYDYGPNGTVNVFDRDGFSLSDADGVLQHYEYGTAWPYKEMPALKRWLIEQQLEQP